MFKAFSCVMCMFLLLVSQQIKAEIVTLSPIIADTQNIQFKSVFTEPSIADKISDQEYMHLIVRNETKYMEIHDTESSVKYFFETNHDSCADRICFGFIPLIIPIPTVYYQSRNRRYKFLLLTTGQENLIMFRVEFKNAF